MKKKRKLKDRVQFSVTDECGRRIEKGQVIRNVYLGDECGIRTEIHGDKGDVWYIAGENIGKRLGCDS